jgi:GxxExxY protein
MNQEQLTEAERVRINRISRMVVDAAMKVHSVLGPGLLESAYEACLAHELRQMGLRVETQVPLPLVYEGVKLEVGYRIDIWVERCLIIELKVVEGILPVHEAQLLSHMKLSGTRLGLLINFKAAHLKEGIRQMVNDF